MTPYAATTSLESPQPLSSDSSGSSAKNSRSERSQTRRSNRSQRNDGKTQSSDSESQETGLVEGGGEHTALVSRSGAGELKVGDRVRILKAKRYQGFFAEVREIEGATASVMPDSPDAKFSMSVAIADLEKCPSVDEVYSAPTHEPGEETAKELEPVSYEHIQHVMPNGWLYSMDGMHLNPSYYQPAPLAPVTPESILTKYGFIDSTDLSDPSDIVEIYRDWGIALAIPNGGILALDIFKSDQSWGKPTENEFDYLDQDGIVNHAKSVIDEIEAAIAASQPPQMTIPGIEEKVEQEPIEIFEVSQVELESFGELNSCQALAENRIKGVISWDGREWVVTGSSSKGLKTLEVDATQVVERSQWTGPIYTYKTLPLAKGGGFANGYAGQLVKYRKRELVLTGTRAEFVPKQAIAQTPGLEPEEILAPTQELNEIESGDLVLIQATRRNVDKTWNGLRGYAEVLPTGVVTVSLQGDYRSKKFRREDLQLLEKCVPSQFASVEAPQPDALDELITDLKDELAIAAPTPAVVMMSEVEARDCVDNIKGHLENTRKLLLDLHEREGWKALGYNSWRECVMAEFGESKSQLYRELEAAKIERNISPIGEIGQIKESHLRPLAKLEPEQQREAWQEAVETAPNGKVTAAHVQEVAEKRLPPVQEELPSLEELFKLYGQIAERVEHRPTHKYRNQFAVERTTHPAFSFYPLGRREAWQAWQRKYRRYLEISPLPPEKQMVHPGYPLSEPKPVVEAFPVQQSCKNCQHRHLIGDGSEFTCGTKGDKWTCAATRDWAQENNGCDKFKPPSLQMVTVQPPVNDKAEVEAATPVEAEPERRIPIYAFDLTISQYNKLAKHAKAAGTSMVGYLQKLVEELPEAH